MIVKTTVTINGAEYDHTCSDAGYMIERDGTMYSEAIDPLGTGREYTETDILIEEEEELSIEDKLKEAYESLEILGVDTSEA